MFVIKHSQNYYFHSFRSIGGAAYTPVFESIQDGIVQCILFSSEEEARPTLARIQQTPGIVAVEIVKLA